MRKLPHYLGALFALLLAFSAFAGPDSAGLVNINTADVAAMAEINGIGPAKAQAIVSYRDANGPFTSVDGLGYVKGIGDKLLNRLRDQVTIGN